MAWKKAWPTPTVKKIKDEAEKVYKVKLTEADISKILQASASVKDVAKKMHEKASNVADAEWEKLLNQILK